MKNYKYLSKSAALASFKKYESKNFEFSEIDFANLDDDEKEFRKNLVSCFKLYESDKYILDINIAKLVYEKFLENKDFDIYVASNIEFWLYLTMKIVPDLYFRRWNEGKLMDHMCGKKDTRNWLYSLWWYYHFCWQGDIDKTYKMIENYSTDMIQALVERVGKKSQHINVYREIIRQYSLIDKETKNNLKIGNKTMIRRIMCLNTAKLVIIDPTLFNGGERGYVTYLINIIRG